MILDSGYFWGHPHLFIVQQDQVGYNYSIIRLLDSLMNPIFGLGPR